MLLSQIRKLKVELKKSVLENESSKKLKKNVKSFFSGTQIKALVGKKKYVRWSSNDISKCIVIRA